MFKRKVPTRRPPAAGVSHLFHGVTITAPDGSACSCAAALDGHRFLSDEAPLLPLPDCTNPAACRCVYRHLDDRRTELRRDADCGLPPRPAAIERRASQARRITD